jgi:hypothetical protein
VVSGDDDEGPDEDQNMNPSCLRHCLTNEERRHFQEHGYLVVPGALDRAEAARLTEAVDRVDARERAAGYPPDRLLSFSNILPEDKAFVDLVDWPRIFPKVWGILGWNVYVYHTHLDVTPPATERPARPVAWHQDSMRANEEMDTHPPAASVVEGGVLSDGRHRSRLGQHAAAARFAPARRTRLPQRRRVQPRGGDPSSR